MSIAPPTDLAPPDPPEVPAGIEVRRGPAWKPWTSFVALIAALAAALIGGLVVYVIAALAGGDVDDPGAAVTIFATLFQDAAFIGSALIFAGLSMRPRPEHFGLRTTRLWRALGLVVGTYVVFVIAAAAWTAALGITDEDDVVDQLGADESTLALLAVAFLVAVVAPLAEEFFFRGFFFGALRNWRGVWPAAVITGLVFGGVHVGSAPVGFLVPLALFGFLLCLLYQRTGSLYPCIALHCVNNSIAFGAGEDWTWQIPVLLVVSLALIALTLTAVRSRWTPA